MSESSDKFPSQVPKTSSGCLVASFVQPTVQILRYSGYYHGRRGHIGWKKLKPTHLLSFFLKYLFTEMVNQLSK